MGVALFQFFGNATRGYVDTASLFWWWISQWIDPQAETQHGWLILGLSGWLFWRNLRQRGSRQNGGSTSEWTGSEAGDAEVVPPFRIRLAPFVAVIGALMLHALGFVAQQTRISILAFLLFTWAVLAMADRRWARAAAFPLGFMIFAIPLNVLDSVGFWLRMGVIDASASIADLIGLDVVRSGTQLFAPDGRYQYDVAAACSGVRSLMALTALSLLIGYLNFQSTWRRGLMLGLCFPLTYLGNVARVTLIIVAAHLGGERWGAMVHDLMGYGIFVIVLGGVLGAAVVVRRVWPEPGDHPAVRVNGESASVRTGSREDASTIEHVSRSSETEGPPPRRPDRTSQRTKRFSTAWMVLVVVGVVLEMAFLARVSTSVERGDAGVRLAENGADPVDLPAFIGTEWIGRRAEVSNVERDILPSDTGFSRRTYVSVADRSHAVFLSIVLSGRDRTSIHRPEICLVGQGWTIDGVTQHTFDGTDRARNPIPATLLRTSLIEPVSQRQIQTVMAYWFVNADAVVATHWQRFWRDAWNRVRHGRVDRWAYVLVQADAQDGEAAALARMETVLHATLPAFLATELQ